MTVPSDPTIDPTHPAVQALADALSAQTTDQQSTGPAPNQAPPSLVWAQVASIQTGPPPTLTVMLAGASSTISSIPYDASYSPVAGDTVYGWQSVTGDYFVVGAMATTAQPSPLEALFPVGEVFISKNCATAAAVTAQLGFGTWAAYGAGRFPVFVGTSDAAYSPGGTTGGHTTTTATEANMPAHSHPGSGVGTSGLSVSGSSFTATSSSTSSATTSTTTTIIPGNHSHPNGAGGGSWAVYGAGGTSTDYPSGPGGALNNVGMQDAVTNDTASSSSSTSVTTSTGTSISGSAGVSGSATISIATDGSGTAMTTVPPWVAVYAWVRTA